MDGSANESLELLPWVCLASSPGHSQILSRSNFLHGCEIKSGSGLGTRVCYSLLTIDSFCFIPSDDGTTLLPPLSQHTWLASCCPLHKTFSMVFVLVGKWYKPHCALTNWATESFSNSVIEFEYLRLSCQGRDSAKANTTLACPMGRVWQARSTSAASVINMSIMHTSPTTKHTYSQRCLGELFHQFEKQFSPTFQLHFDSNYQSIIGTLIVSQTRLIVYHASTMTFSKHIVHAGYLSSSFLK